VAGDLLVAESFQDQINDFGFARRDAQGSEQRIQVRVPGLERTFQGTPLQEMSEIEEGREVEADLQGGDEIVGEGGSVDSSQTSRTACRQPTTGKATFCSFRTHR
jgi:hypothetical protein